MIGYVTLGTNNLEQAVDFYDALLAELGAKRVFEMDTSVAWSTGEGAPMLAVIKPFDGKEATVGNGTMVALPTASKEAAGALHAKALALGASDEGAPGDRGHGFYCAYVRDLDGNKLNFFCMS